jgi:hypothetical protein
MSSKGREFHVKAATNLAPWGVLHCPRCPNTISSGYEQDFKYQWSLKLKCAACRTSWWVCHLCVNQRTHLTENSQLARHNHHKFHKEKLATGPSEEPHQEPTVNTHAPKELSSFNSFCRKASQDYFRAASKGNGQRYLIVKALGQESTILNLDDDNIDLMMSLSHLLSQLLLEIRESSSQKSFPRLLRQQDGNTEWKC